jgi:NCS1 family nucleobase:cation symporter-1
VPRPFAAFIDGIIMVGGSIYVVFFADNFVGQFEGFLFLVGVPIAAWCGVMLADLLLRRRDYAEPELFDARGRYGSASPVPLLCVVVGSVIGWGLDTNTAARGTAWLDWQGYLLAPFGLGGKSGAWAYANLGVLAALVIGFVVTLLATPAAVRRQEARGAAV